MFLLDEQIGFNLQRVAVLFRRELIRCLREYKLTPEQWQVLAMLWQEKLLTQKQILHLTLQDAPSTSKMLVRMEKSGFISIQDSNKDKRVKIISLTTYGRSLEKILPNKVLNHFNPILDSMPSTKRKTFLVLLKQFRKILGDTIHTMNWNRMKNQKFNEWIASDKNMNEIEEYITNFPIEVQSILREIRKLIQKEAPESIESFAYGMPAYKTNGNPLVYFSGFKNHIGFYATPSGHIEFSKELSHYKQGKGSVQFPLNKPIPMDLIRKIVQFRVKENLSKSAKKSSKK